MIGLQVRAIPCSAVQISLLGGDKFPVRSRQGIRRRRLELPRQFATPIPATGQDLQDSLLNSLFSGNSRFRETLVADVRAHL